MLNNTLIRRTLFNTTLVLYELSPGRVVVSTEDQSLAEFKKRIQANQHTNH